jgi:hypothetical protein
VHDGPLGSPRLGAEVLPGVRRRPQPRLLIRGEGEDRVAALLVGVDGGPVGAPGGERGQPGRRHQPGRDQRLGLATLTADQMLAPAGEPDRVALVVPASPDALDPAEARNSVPVAKKTGSLTMSVPI